MESRHLTSGWTPVCTEFARRVATYLMAPNTEEEREKMKPRTILSLLALTFLISGVAPNVSAIVVTWNPQTFEGLSETDFNDATMTFTGFQANSLDSISGGGNGEGEPRPEAFYHIHAANTTLSLEVRVDSSWQTIYTETLSSGGDTFISDWFVPTSFTAGTVDGIRFTSTLTSSINQTWHGWVSADSQGTPPAVWTGNPVTFNFVPIPPAVWLFGSGLLGLVGIARRKKAA